MTIECSGENINKLAEAIVDSWDMDTLMGYAVSQLEVFYTTDEETFQVDWKETIDDGVGLALSDEDDDTEVGMTFYL